MKLEIRRLSLRLEQFALEVKTDLHNARTGIFGPSGSGKTSLLEVIAGLRRPETVRICLDDQLFDDTVRGYSCRSGLRKIGYVPQDDRSFHIFPFARIYFTESTANRSATHSLSTTLPAFCRSPHCSAATSGLFPAVKTNAS